ncbi:exonuclease SbcCD subunit D [Marinicellulosiphila megalodicopiae]|uniref:exonuclease SbcCD subunit D n=1 Tax=Marinicellulosiphila megalodicopiae TaxID=2724896 RepID=UPI003BAFAFE0
MRILHTSDWHIGRQFHNVSLLDDQKVCLEQLIEMLKVQKIDLLLIAGDIYDRSVPPAEAVSILHKTLSHICLELKIKVVIISGNHDGPERLGFGADLLQQSGLYILTDIKQIASPIKIQINNQSVNVYGIPYCQPEHVRNVFKNDVKTFDDAHTFLVDQITQSFNKDDINILMSHCFVGGSEVSESERPLSIGGADTVTWQPMAQFDYVALGHLHAPQYRGETHIRYSGSLMKYSFSEVNQKKSVTIIECSKDEQNKKVTDIQMLPISQPKDCRIIEDEFETIIRNSFTDTHPNDYLLIRVTDKHAIIDAIGKLRTNYPNILHLEKTGMLADTQITSVTREQLKRSEFELFSEFYEQTQNEKISPQQTEVLTDLINQLHTKEPQS